jgi:hypothetical protein
MINNNLLRMTSPNTVNDLWTEGAWYVDSDADKQKLDSMAVYTEAEGKSFRVGASSKHDIDEYIKQNVMLNKDSTYVFSGYIKHHSSTVKNAL